jgi:UDP-N-acetylglucosamine--N-acetylmuramyl-(pentapeptide) pyrophosphoryl-undecaprenol N-acetylglucosamine transferase
MIAAGGTGGHVYPAQALARCLRARGLGPAFVTDHRGAGFADDLADVPAYRVRASAITGGGWRGLAMGIFDLGLGCVQAWRLIRRLAPRAAVGFGGYASVAPILVAARMGLPTIIHEANAVMGRANRLLAPRTSAIATSFSTTLGIAVADRDKVTRTGNPVRSGVVAITAKGYPEPSPGDVIRLLVFGGSQGAAVMSRVVPAALTGLPDALRARLRVVQQCRTGEIASVREQYRRADIPAELTPFIDDMPARLAAAHLVICRAGASTLAELAVVGRPAILVPYPHATDDHQLVNARAMAHDGGGWLIQDTDFAAETLAAMIEELLAEPRLLARAAERAAALGQGDAADRLAQLTERLIDEIRQARSAA